MDLKDLYKADYEAAIHNLWELHNQCPDRYSWPPSQSDLSSAIETIQTARKYDKEKR